MKCILFNSEVHESYGLYKDLEDLDSVDVILRKERTVNNKLLKKIKHVHLSGSISKYINLPLKNIWYSKCDLRILPGEEYYLIFDDLALKSFSQKELNDFTKRNNIKCILVLLNSMDSEIMSRSGIKRKIIKTAWEDVYTFDLRDVEKYKFKFLDYHYYSKHNVSVDEDIKYDLFYVGALYSERKKLIYEIYRSLVRHGVLVDFHLQKHGVDNKKTLPYSDKIHYFTGSEGRLSYEEIITGDLGANTILEVVQNNQSGPTLRYFEAVVYNRKLLTNNPEIVNFPFYNEKYMKIFKQPRDIDFEWIKSGDRPDYKYDNEFSPVHLVESIVRE